MTKKIKKSVSILLALVMLCGVLAVAPITVGATATTYTTADGKGTYSFDPVTGELHLVSGEFTGTAWISNETWTVNAINPENILSITAAEPVNGVKVVKFTGDCSRMFGGYPKSPLEKCVTIDLSNVDTSAMTKTNRMFNHDKSLSTLNLSGINTSNVTDMDYMFNDCPSLTTLDLSSFNTNKLKVVEGGLFAGCTNLKNLTISQNFKSGITGIMKLNNGILKKGWVSMDGTIVSGSTTSDYAVIAAPEKTTTYVWYSGSYEFIPETGELHLISGFFNGNSWQYEYAQGMHWTANQAKDEEYIESAAKVKSITANPGVKFTGDCKNMFIGFSNCETIDLSNVDTSNVTNMWCMFYNCTNLTDIDVSKFDTSNVTAIRYMFGNCGKLTELDLSSFDTGSVINGNMPETDLDACGNVFLGCSKLRKLTISDKFDIGIEEKTGLNNGRPTDKGWITSDSTNGEIVSGSTTSDYAVIAAPEKTTTYVWYSGVYEFIPETGELHLISGFFNGSYWQYEDARGMHWTANQAKDEEYIESAAKVKSITANPGVKFTGDCKNMFRGFSNCETIDLSNVDTSNVTNMWCMFYNCTNLTDIDVSKFDTSNVTAIRYMFGNCGKLTELDLSSFDTGSVINGNMPETDLDACGNVFGGCSELRSLTISDGFNLGIQSKMALNNGGVDGWRISPSDYADRVSGDGTYAVMEQPSDETTYKWIEYGTVTWKNWDNSTLRTEDYKLETTVHPTYKGETPNKPDSAGKFYTFAGWTDGETEYGLNAELPLVTNDVTYTAVFSETPKKFFAAHSISLDGDIGVNFYIDVTVAGITPEDIISGDSTLTLNFSWDTDPAPVTDVSKDNFTLSKSNASRYYDEDKGYFKIKCNVAAAEMACKIKADGIVAGAKDYTESEIYSVRDYGMTIINNPSKYSETLVDLAKKLLDYGAKAQEVFKILPGDLANKDVSYTMTNVSANDIQAAIEAEPANKGKTASDMASGTSDFGLRYASSTVVYLTKSTLRHYYYIDDQGKYDNVKAKFNERKLPVAVYIEYSDIAAADLDKLQTFAIDSTHTYYYSALNYAKDVIGSNSSKDENKKLAMAMYWYNQAANAYFK